MQATTSAYEGFVRQLVVALHAHGVEFTPLSLERDDIGGVARYDADDDRLVFDVLVVTDEQGVTAGRYLYRFINGAADFKPSFELQTDDLDAVIGAMRSHSLL